MLSLHRRKLLGAAGLAALLVGSAQADTPFTSFGFPAVIPPASPSNRTDPVRWGEIFNVKDFGAMGDGVTDDTAAIQAAFNANRLATSAPTVSGNTLHFSSIPSWVIPGLPIANTTTGSSLFGGTVITAVGVTTLTLSANVASTVGAGDVMIIGSLGRVFFPTGIYQVSSSISLPASPASGAPLPQGIIEGTGNSLIRASPAFNGFIFDDNVGPGQTLHPSSGPWQMRGLNLQNSYRPTLVYRSGLKAAASWARTDPTITVTNASSSGIAVGAILFADQSGGTFASGAVPAYIGYVTTVSVGGTNTTLTLGDTRNGGGAQVPSLGATDTLRWVQGYFANGAFTTSSPNVTMNVSNPGLDAGYYYVWDWTKITNGNSVIPPCLGVTASVTNPNFPSAVWSGTSVVMTTNVNVASVGTSDLLVFSPISGAMRHVSSAFSIIESCNMTGVIALCLDETTAVDVGAASPAPFGTTVRNCLFTNGVGTSSGIGQIGLYCGQSTLVQNCDFPAHWIGCRLYETNCTLIGGRQETCCYAIVLGGITHGTSSNTGVNTVTILDTEAEGSWVAGIINDGGGQGASWNQIFVSGYTISANHQNSCYGIYISSASQTTITNTSISGSVLGAYGSWWNPSLAGPGQPSGIYIANSVNPQALTFMGVVSTIGIGSYNIANNQIGRSWTIPTSAGTATFINCNNPPSIFTFASLPTGLPATASISGNIITFSAGTFSRSYVVGSLVVGAGITANTIIIGTRISGAGQSTTVNNSQTVGSVAVTVYPMVDGDEYMISDSPTPYAGNFGTPVTVGGGTNRVKVRWSQTLIKWIIV